MYMHICMFIYLQKSDISKQKSTFKELFFSVNCCYSLIFLRIKNFFSVEKVHFS